MLFFASFAETNSFKTAVWEIASVRCLFMYITITWFSRGCVIDVLKYVFIWHIADALRSDMALVPGIRSTNFTICTTYDIKKWWEGGKDFICLQMSWKDGDVISSTIKFHLTKNLKLSFKLKVVKIILVKFCNLLQLTWIITIFAARSKTCSSFV